MTRCAASTVRPVIRLAIVVVLCLAGTVAAAQQSDAGDGPRGTWFVLDTLNAGLPAPDGRIDRDTPQGAVESYLDALGDGDSLLAAHMLNLNGIPRDAQASVGPRLARQLQTILERRAILSWRALLERPDALDSQQSSNAALAGQPRRSLLLGVLELQNREVAIRLNRVRVGDSDPVWVFSERTVSQIPRLYAAHGPSPLERALPESLKAKTPIGLRVWEVIGIPVVIVLAVIVGRLVHRPFAALEYRVGQGWPRMVARSLHWPLVIAAVTTVILTAGLHVFTVSGIVASVLTPLVVIGYVVAVLLFLVEVIDTILEYIVTFDTDRLEDRDNSDYRTLATVLSGGRRLLIVIVLLVGLGVVLSEANVFRSLGFSLLASAGALTVIFGFAGRQVLGNIMASLQIALNRSARIGDQVIYEGHWCTVERIHFTYVQLKIWTGNRLVVPVSRFVSDDFENWTHSDAAMTVTFKLTLAHKADLDALRDSFHKAVADDPDVTDADAAKMIVYSQDAFGPVVRFQAPAADPKSGWAMECRLREAVLAAARRIEDETGRPMLPQGGLDDMAG
ncbi:hypothetical protein OCGS_2290 [Oceaniovalibus guishaninsula JLT2003]|uniref:Mechanosensitive ion channel MscS domain-containing protein n=1 Tax=Oceaniovalibus guishaninsula JLT2003 TaxID=1231392 RepID=K2H7G4_9RHOB|nr:mechanosensitive ion channel family protein [Oceaniovalibus guishaninsula]EKE43558.1 hypothetical protein OCGS_2290 [Oceaniovalibus guishaninsula JLT2003]